MTLPDDSDDLELELRRLPAVIAVGFVEEGKRLVVELALADGTSEPHIASVRERAELLARGRADEVTVRVVALPATDPA